LRRLDRWKVVGLEGLTKASDDYALASGLRDAARELKKHARRRALQTMASELLESAREADADVDALLERCHGQLAQLERSDGFDALIPVREVVARTIEDIRHRATGVIRSV